MNEPQSPVVRRLLAPYIVLGVLFVVVTTAFILWRREPPESEPQFTALTTNAAEQAVVAEAISPDGRYLAYFDLSGLYVRQVGSVESRRIESPPGALPTLLEWFPDNAHLLASGFDQRQGRPSVWSASILGGVPNLLHDDATLATVAPDGKRIAFVSKSNQIWIADSDGSNARVFVALAGTDYVAARLQFSPDGRYLLHGHGVSGTNRVTMESRRLDDGTVTQLLDLPTYPLDFQLLASGALILSRMLDNEFGGALIEEYRIDLDSGFKTDTPVLLAKWPHAVAYGITAPRDAERVTLIKDMVQSDIYVADLAPTGDSIANVRRLTLDNAKDRPSAWLADNRTILFHSDRGGRWGLYRQAIDQTSAEMLVRDGRSVRWPTVSPDQKWMLYLSGADDQTAPRVMRQSLLGGPPELVASGGSVARKVHCPRFGNRCILMERDGDQRVFFALDPLRGRGRELARSAWSPQSWLDWDVNPDGTSVAAVDPHGVRDRIVVIPLDGDMSSRKVISVQGYQSLQSLYWDAQGKGFFTSSNDTLAGALLHVGLDGSTTFLRRQVFGDGWAIPSPDGRHLAIQEYTVAGNVWLLQMK